MLGGGKCVGCAEGGESIGGVSGRSQGGHAVRAPPRSTTRSTSTALTPSTSKPNCAARDTHPSGHLPLEQASPGRWDQIRCAAMGTLLSAGDRSVWPTVGCPSSRPTVPSWLGVRPRPLSSTSTSWLRPVPAWQGCSERIASRGECLLNFARILGVDRASCRSGPRLVEVNRVPRRNSGLLM